ncbi:MFS transporter [Phenylobacterium sp.]|jgi:Na+/melibiose symporter-like transporter|uniref:MFS transporter n=1 Tax=Phenylobacterium sp. TaxID=1871053 RepID=UPI002F3F56FB
MAAYALPCLPLAGLGLPLVVYLPEFYASELGLSLTAVGATFLLVRLLDIGFDPFIGAVMDATRSRFGRFRLWLALSVPILMVATWQLFMARPGVGTGYLLVWLLAVYAGTSISSLAQIAWGAVLSPDYNQRSRIYAWWQAGNVVGMVLVLTLPALLPFFGIKAHSAGVAAMGWFVVVLTPLTVALAVWRVPEPLVTTAPSRASAVDYLGLLGRRNVLRILAADFLIGAGPAITGALFFFFFERVKGFDKGAASLLLLAYFIGGLAGAPLWAWLAVKLGKHRALAVSNGIYAALTLCALAIPPGDTVVAGVLMFLIGVPFAAGAFLLRAMMADVGDEVRLATGVDRTGLLYALLSGTVKIGSAAAVGVAFPLLQAFGFDARASGGPAGLHGLQGLFVGLPAALSVLAGWLVLRHPLTARRHRAIRDALARADASPPLAPAVESSPSGSLHARPRSRPAD